jgi:hypothetical protein
MKVIIIFIILTFTRGVFLFFLLGSLFMPNCRNWDLGDEALTGRILAFIFCLFGGFICLRAFIENSNVWARDTVTNLFREFNLSVWKKF